MELKVSLQENSYSIHIEKGILDNINELIKSVYQGSKIMIISDDNVYGYYGDKITSLLEKDFIVGHTVIPHGEQSKRFDILPSLYSSLLEFKLTRSDLIIALGGGVIGDLAGFVAATYMRGVKLVQVPTSLLAQVDSSVGGKVAVDLPEGKNLVGAFYHPKMVIIDPTTLKTLPQRYLNDGMGEVIKYGCIKDQQLFNDLANYKDYDELMDNIDKIIYTCVNIKRIVVENDQFDFGERILLNFGHTIGHAIEQYHHYEKYSHGEAVSIGMVQLTKICEEHQLCPINTSEKIKEVCIKYGLPTSSDLLTSDLVAAINLDKKNLNKKLSLVVLKDIGESYVYPSDVSFITSKERV